MAGADIQATYGVQILVEGEDKAADAADELERLRDNIAEDTAALREMQTALRRMQGAAGTTKESFAALRAQIAAKKEALGQSSAALLKMKGAFDGLGPAAKKAEVMRKAGDEARKKAFADAKLKYDEWQKDVRENDKRIRDSVGKNTSLLKTMVGGYLAASLAVAAATAAVVAFGAASADARRDERIELQAAGTRLWLGYGEAVQWVADVTEKEADAIQYAVDRVSRSTATAREKVTGFAAQLEEAGLRGQDLEKALHAVSSAAAVGKEAGLVGSFSSARFFGQSIDQLANRIETKLGPIAQKRMLSLDVQAEKLSESFHEMWKGINIGPFLEQISRVFGLFSQTSVIGYELRQVLTALFPSEHAKTFGDVAQAALEYTTIAALATILTILRLRNVFLDFNDWIKAHTPDWAKGFNPLLEAIKAVIKLIPGLGPLFQGLELAKDVIDLAANSGQVTGQSLADGMKDGIEAGKPGVGAAAVDLGDYADQRFRENMAIQSPSRVWFDAGEMLGAGAAGGMRASSDKVEAAAGDLSEAARPKADVPAGGARGGVSVTVQVAPGAVVVHGAGGDTKRDGGWLADVEAGVAEAFERAAQQLSAQLETT